MQRAVRAELARSDPAPGDTANYERTGAVREVTGALDRGDRPHAGEAAVETRHEHDLVAGNGGRFGRALRLVGLEGNRHHHLRQHNALREGQQGQELSLGV